MTPKRRRTPQAAASPPGSRGRIITDLLRKTGLPVPLRLELPVGKDLTDFMNERRTA
jgi:hypothetical protein